MSSLLGDLDNRLIEGDIIFDPFSLLEVQKIVVEGYFTSFVDVIDIDKLRSETSQFDYDNWMFILSDSKYLMYSFESREKIIRLAWWVCFNLVCKNNITISTHPLKINIQRLIKDNALTDATLIIYKSVFRNSLNFNDINYSLSLMLPTADYIDIILKNIDLIEYENII